MIVFLFVFMLGFNQVSAKVNSSDQTIEKLVSTLNNSSTDVLVGKILTVESKWVNNTSQHRIISFVTMQILTVEKGLHKQSEVVSFIFEGGTVGSITLTVYLNPWGVLHCTPGEIVRIFSSKDATMSQLRAHKIEIINDSGVIGIKSIPGTYIYEENGCGFEYTGTHLDSNDFPYTYRVNQNCADLTGEGTEVEDAFQTWESLSNSNLDFTRGADCSTTSYSQNSVNEIFWGTSLGASEMAATYTWTSGSEITEFDIEFNDDEFTWCNGQVSNQADVQNIATHEIGHTIHLSDLYDSSNNQQTMYYTSYTYEIKKRTLESGDSWGAQYIFHTYEPATIDITSPSTTVAPSTSVTVRASVSSGYTISEVKYKVTSETGFTYDTGWTTMNLVGGYYERSWTTPSTLGDYYVTVYVKHNQNIYAFEWQVTTVAQI